MESRSKRRKRQIALHVGFSLGVLLLLFSGSYYFFLGRLSPGRISGYFFFLLCIYAGRWLCARWFRQDKPVLFLFCTAGAFLIILVGWFYFTRWVLGFHHAGFLEFSFDRGPALLLGLVTGILIKFIRTSLQKQIRDARLAAEQKQSELNLLQSQLSPHFLFNTLNNMYGIAIADHQRIPALLLKLSDLLRYSVYETKRPFVSLKEELEYIANYIEFEKIRISDRLLLKTSIGPVDHTGVRIAPMVLIVFVENAFKHAKDTLEQKIHVEIDIKVSNGFIKCMIGNSYRKEKEESGLLDESSGLGLANTIKRLDLLYGEQYVLKHFIRNETYIVELALKIM
jgi:sensor histidine kinase YesM